MQGLFLRRMFSEPAPAEATISVTGTGNRTFCYIVTPSGETVTSGNHTFLAQRGEIIECHCGSYAIAGTVTVNGVVVGSGTFLTYNYAVNKNASIELAVGGKDSYKIHITEE